MFQIIKIKALKIIKLTIKSILNLISAGIPKWIADVTKIIKE